jgi:hypothetical protein
MAVKDSNFEMLHFFVAPPSIANNNDHVANGDDLGIVRTSKASASRGKYESLCLSSFICHVLQSFEQQY